MKDFDKYEVYKKYHGHNYGPELQGYFLTKSHKVVEKIFDPTFIFNNVLEVGCGSGEHFQHVIHQFESYLMTDVTDKFTEQLKAKFGTFDSRNDGLKFQIVDPGILPFENCCFDRVIACHVLEHVPEPESVLFDWYRVLKTDGVLSILLPCDPGLLWRFGRATMVRPRMKRRGIPYDYIMAQEHINSIWNLLAIIDFHFGVAAKTNWFPLNISCVDANLFCAINIFKR